MDEAIRRGPVEDVLKGPSSLETIQCEMADLSSAFAMLYKNRVRYLKDRDCFCVYDGTRWELDGRKSPDTFELVEDFVRAGILLFSNKQTETEMDKERLKFIKTFTSRRKKEEFVRDLTSKPLLKCTTTDFDKDLHLFNVINGTIDINTGEMRPHNPEDLIMQRANVVYDPEVRSELWEKTVAEIMQGDKELIDHIQEVLGYCLSGSTRFERFFILYGPSTRNGKSTIMDTILNIMGDYGATANYTSFQESSYRGNGSSPSTDIASLRGARFVSIPEPSDETVLNVSKLKTFTGGDKIKARFLYQDEFEYTPTYKLFFNTNYRPRLKAEGRSLFDSDRVEVIPFNRHFEDSERDLTLKDKLKSDREKSGILNWMLEGYRRVLASGKLPMPEAVRNENVQYREENDKVLQFVNEEMEESPGSSMTGPVFFERFVRWCERNKYPSMGRQTVYRMLREKGIADDSRGKQLHVNGYKFLADNEQNPFPV